MPKFKVIPIEIWSHSVILPRSTRVKQLGQLSPKFRLTKNDLTQIFTPYQLGGYMFPEYRPAKKKLVKHSQNIYFYKFDWLCGIGSRWKEGTLDSVAGSHKFQQKKIDPHFSEIIWGKKTCFSSIFFQKIFDVFVFLIKYGCNNIATTTTTVRMTQTATRATTLDLQQQLYYQL